MHIHYNWFFIIETLRHFFYKLINTLRPRQNGRHIPDDIFKWIFLNENIWILINISLMFVPRGPINNIPTLVQVMAWHRPGDKPLSEPMMVYLLTHICVTLPQWVKLEFSWFSILPSVLPRKLVLQLGEGSLTFTLHSPNNRQFAFAFVGICHADGLWKMIGIPTCHIVYNALLLMKNALMWWASPGLHVE